MSLVVGIDFETSGLSPVEDRIIEVGMVLWDWEAKLPLQMLSAFVEPGVPIPEEIKQITGITEEMIALYGKSESEVFAEINNFLEDADYAMAHNGNEFDLKFYVEGCKRCGCAPRAAFWLDSLIDIKYPEAVKTRNLGHLAADHGFLNPFRHRAVFDVMTMLTVASNYPLEQIVARAQEPTLYIQAISTFEQKDHVKSFGFHWFPAEKLWWKAMKASDFEAERGQYEFKTGLLDRAPE